MGKPNRGLLQFAILCMAFMVLGLQPSFLWSDATNHTPKDEDEACHWMRKSLARSGYVDINFEKEVYLVRFTILKNHQKLAILYARSLGTEVTREPTTSFWKVLINDYADEKPGDSRILFSRKDDAENFKAALDFLSRQAQHELDAKSVTLFDQFETQAKAWRDLAVKSQMPEEARKHRILAEEAYQEKNLLKAESEYLKALEIFPCWPEGQFNLALIASEQKSYRTAILHMKEYLALAPDASDARAAKDKMIIWQDKITRP